jgi:FkbM family methyltransferase
MRRMPSFGLERGPPRMSKQVLLSDTPFIIDGMSADDPYFAAIADNTENQLTLLCKALLPEKAGVWDIGANIGVTALTMAAINPNWQILAVEGGPVVHKVLSRNIRENGRSGQITCVHAAAGESDGAANFYEASAYGHPTKSGGIPVLMVSAETLHREFGPQSIDFVKIDIEGSEFPFMRGALGLFKRQGSIICMEFNVLGLMRNGEVLPTKFMVWLVANFADVRLLQHEGLTTQRIVPDNLYDVIY